MCRWLRSWYRSQVIAVIRHQRAELRRLRKANALVDEALWREIGDTPFELSKKEYRRLMKHRSRMGAARFDEASNIEFDIDPENPRIVRLKRPASC